MFKFSQLTKPINLIEILRSQYICQKRFENRSASVKKRKLIKYKSNSRRKNSSNVTYSGLFRATDSPSSLQKLAMSSSTRTIATTSSQISPSGSSESDKKDQECRQFEKLNTRNHHSETEGLSFTFMSYNILAQDLLELHSHLYQDLKPKYLRWKYRLDRIANEILALRPEILCLQEVQQDHIPMILKALEKLDYDHIFKKKTGEKTDGCAILYNKNLFNLIERHSVEYYQPNIEFLNRENVALIAKLCVKSHPSSCFIASTTHLLYNPNRQDVRLAQVQLLLAELDRVSFKGFHSNGKPRRLPIILAGDFNLEPDTAPYQLITSGRLSYYNLTKRSLETPINNPSTLIGYNFLPFCLGITDFCQHYDLVKNNYQGESRIQNTDNKKLLDPTCSDNSSNKTLDGNHQWLFSTGELKHNLKFSSVYDLVEKQRGSTFQDKWITVDYIFYSENFNRETNAIDDSCLKLISRYSLPSLNSRENKNIRLIPNSHVGSDHFSLAAKFFLRIPKIS